MKQDFDSKEEMYFSWYLDELVDAGYVRNYDLHPREFILTNKQTVQVEKQLKTKVKVIEKTFLQPHVYTPDFYIRWLHNADDIFLSKIKGSGVFWAATPVLIDSFIEIKPTFSRYNMARVFSLNQKWMYNKYGIYVQLIKPFKLFKDTFTPVRFLTTDKSGQARKLNYTPISLIEFVEKRRY